MKTIQRRLQSTTYSQNINLKLKKTSKQKIAFLFNGDEPDFCFCCAWSALATLRALCAATTRQRPTLCSA